MKKNYDILTKFDGLTIIHQKIPPKEVGQHQHDAHEFFMPLQGDITVHFGDKKSKAGPGRMLYVPPSLNHSFSSAAIESGERLIWLIHPKRWEQHVQEYFQPSSFPVNTLAKELLFYLLIHKPAKGSNYFLSVLIETLFESLKLTSMNEVKIYSEHLLSKIKDQRILNAIKMIDNNLVNNSLPEIAKKSGMSQRNFNRLFLKELNMTPKDYLIHRRVDKARALLKETQMTITDISLEVGYNSVSKFIATFKKVQGVLPSDYRWKK